MKNVLQQLEQDRESYDNDSKAFIDSLRFVDKELGSLNEMKRTEGWKILDKKIREELQNRINTLVKDDLNIQTLLALLHVTDTRTLEKNLEEEISKLIPE